MSFEHFYNSLSTFEVVSIIFALTVSLACFLGIFLASINTVSHGHGAKIFYRREVWQGRLYNTRIDCWQQTTLMHNNNVFVDIFFFLDNKLTSAKALITPAQLHLLRKDLPIVVKKGKKNNIAVMQLGAWEAE
ncbi:hypothetical protein [Kosakonia cowanii]|uniref:hypothetical protein n=1 Tax=Kosakonia cowanii TaxID=208223 RepID=UPI00289962DD|nr:hypothetical protein [Kosakonia cowanii]